MRLRVDFIKNSNTAASSHHGEFDASTTTEAPERTSAKSSPVTVLTPEMGMQPLVGGPSEVPLSAPGLPSQPPQ
jgi:hypothetical protein